MIDWVIFDESISHDTWRWNRLTKSGKETIFGLSILYQRPRIARHLTTIASLVIYFLIYLFRMLSSLQLHVGIFIRSSVNLNWFCLPYFPFSCHFVWNLLIRSLEPAIYVHHVDQLKLLFSLIDFQPAQRKEVNPLNVIIKATWRNGLFFPPQSSFFNASVLLFNPLISIFWKANWETITWWCKRRTLLVLFYFSFWLTAYVAIPHVKIIFSEIFLVERYLRVMSKSSSEYNL